MELGGTVGSPVAVDPRAGRVAAPPVELDAHSRPQGVEVLGVEAPMRPGGHGILDLEGGGTVKGNLVDIDPDPAKLRFGMPVRMVFRDASQANAEGAGHLAHFFVPA